VIDAGVALQSAIYTALKGNASLMAVIDDVHDDVPAGAVFPYIAIGDHTGVDWSTKTTTGLDHTLELHVWSQSDGKKQALEILKLIEDVLDDQPLTLTDHNLITLRREFRTVMTDVDQSLRHGILRFRALTHQ
jgi:uncharacterized protein DUF3168